MAVKFSHIIAGDIYIQNPDRGNTLNQKITYSIGRTAGNKVYAYKKGVNFKYVRLLWSELRNEEKVALETFFNNIDGPGNTFTYTDQIGRAHV